MAANQFQTTVAANPSPGIEGAFAGDNPYFSLITPDEGMFVADATNPPVIGRFAWVNTANGKASSQHPGVATTRVGFVLRDQPVVANATMLSGYSMTLVGGQACNLLDDGTVWGRFAAGATIGQKVYMAYADGSLTSAATSSAATVTRSITTTSGSATISYTGGAIYPGQPVSGTGVAAGSYVVSVNSGAGTAVLSANASASGTVTGTFTTNFETSWSVRSTAGNGELAKISVRG